VSDLRVCELDALGATLLDVGQSHDDPVEATLDGVRLLWGWGVLHLAREADFDRWAVSRVATCEAYSREDVARAVAEVLR
jgi:hypothetical protein